MLEVAPRVAFAAAFAWCTLASAAPDPQILSPPDGAVVTSPFTVQAKYGDVEYCDTGGCTDVPALYVELYVGPDNNATAIGKCDTSTECPDGKATFEVTLEPGEHVLRVIASDDFIGSASSENITITVEASATTTDGSTSTDGTETTSTTSPGTTDPVTTGGTTDPGTTGPDTTGPGTTGDGTSTTGDTTKGADTGSNNSKDDGCGCQATNESSSALLWLAAPLLLFRRRR
ncbi:MYXO-CTERM sorting domain-containing protein [Nannocystis punicea]|uniref:MYXO-CTERM sorting domain-containing protein n=1 Tax=Nannocystis punicea TaxID=2995304 RepID=A0ABY7GWM7_9BACT|nr:MYXO-CTERM sorting domain-containing protein [Nannocystis poenicansa]WAS91393.1 MYXO-CTERM sorting domain-containing protein [Nannocystis poenicansa]